MMSGLSDLRGSTLKKFADGYLEYQRELISKIDWDRFVQIVDMLDRARLNKKTIYTCGNGGSASTAGHLATDLMFGARLEPEQAFKVISLNENISIITALANDFGYDQVYEKQLELYGVEGDVLLVISASGNSTNLMQAVTKAKKLGMYTSAFLGFDGGSLQDLVDVSLVLNSNTDDYGPVEDFHLMCNHIIGNYFRINSAV